MNANANIASLIETTLLIYRYDVFPFESEYSTVNDDI